MAARKYIRSRTIKEISIKKYQSSGYGITFEDLTEALKVKKNHAQRSLKHFHNRHILFTAKDLVDEGIDLMQNTNPQQYFPVSIKAEILEDLRKRKTNVPVEPTELNLQKSTIVKPYSSSASNEVDKLEHQKAQSFLQVLLLIPFVPLYIHKLQLMLYINKEYYIQLQEKETAVNRSKICEEIIGRRHVKYVYSPNGAVGIDIISSTTPFKIEADEDESILFSFLGQARQRLLYHINDRKEIGVPHIMEWVLKTCDLNRDVKVSDKAQITLPDIQLKYVDRVFRLYIKSLQGRAVGRAEEGVKLDLPLVEALDDIRHPYKSIEYTLNEMRKDIKELKSK